MPLASSEKKCLYLGSSLYLIAGVSLTAGVSTTAGVAGVAAGGGGGGGGNAVEDPAGGGGGGGMGAPISASAGAVSGAASGAGAAVAAEEEEEEEEEEGASGATTSASSGIEESFASRMERVVSRRVIWVLTLESFSSQRRENLFRKFTVLITKRLTDATVLDGATGWQSARSICCWKSEDAMLLLLLLHRSF